MQREFWPQPERWAGVPMVYVEGAGLQGPLARSKYHVGRGGGIEGVPNQQLASSSGQEKCLPVPAPPHMSSAATRSMPPSVRADPHNRRAWRCGMGGNCSCTRRHWPFNHSGGTKKKLKKSRSHCMSELQASRAPFFKIQFTAAASARCSYRQI